MTRRASGLSMTGSMSSAAWLKRSSAMRRSSPGRRNGAGVATRSCTVLPLLALAGSLTLAGSMTPHRRPLSSTTNTCLMLPGGKRLRSSSSDKPAAAQFFGRRIGSETGTEPHNLRASKPAEQATEEKPSATSSAAQPRRKRDRRRDSLCYDQRGHEVQIEARLLLAKDAAMAAA